MKLERILAVAGIILLLVITIAIINTYTDLFKEVFKEDKQTASVEEKPSKSPKPKDAIPVLSFWDSLSSYMYILLRTS